MTRRLSALRARAAAHPVAGFLLGCLGWSWGLWTGLFAYGGRATLASAPPAGALAIAAAGAFGPLLAGLAMTALVDGRPGLAALGARVRDVRLGRWWAALALIPATSLATPLLRGLAGHPQDWPGIAAALGPGIALGLFAGLTEEVGWRGFLLPRLMRRRSPWRAAILVGLVWGGLWHGYADFFGVTGTGWRYVALMLLLGPGVLTAWSIVLTKVHLHTGGSLAASILMHATISSTALAFRQSYADVGEELAWTAVSVALAWGAAIALWTAIPAPAGAAGATNAPQRRPA